jgi:hypothetical protein
MPDAGLVPGDQPGLGTGSLMSGMNAMSRMSPRISFEMAASFLVPAA